MRSITKTTPGLQVPLFFAPVLFPYAWEYALHQILASDHRPYKIGSGRTEWFRVGFLFGNVLFIWSILVGWWLIWVLAGLFIWEKLVA